MQPPVVPPWEDYEEHWGFVPWSGRRVLDLGADQGSTAYYFLQQGATFVVGVERSEGLYAVGCQWAEGLPVSMVHLCISEGPHLEALLRDYGCTAVKVDIEGSERLLLDLSIETLRLAEHYAIEVHGSVEPFVKKFAGAGFQVADAGRWDFRKGAGNIVHFERLEDFMIPDPFPPSALAVVTEPIEVLFLASNRREYTAASFAALMATVRPQDRVVVFLDGDDCGTLEEIRPRLREQDEVHETRLWSPVAVMNAYLDLGGQTAIFAKIDNDLIVCPYWIECGLYTMQRYPEFTLVGIEPRGGGVSLGGHGIEQYSHIGGVGFMRRHAFWETGRPTPDGRFGFGAWQDSYSDRFKYGFLVPSLPVFLLDHLPWPPWSLLGREYVGKGWQRDVWGLYNEEHWWELWSWWRGSAAERDVISRYSLQTESPTVEDRVYATELERPYFGHGE